MIHIICLLMTFSSLSRLTHKTFEERAGGGGDKRSSKANVTKKQEIYQTLSMSMTV